MSVEATIRNLLAESEKFKAAQEEEKIEEASINAKDAVAPESVNKMDKKNSPSDGSGDQEDSKKNNVATSKEAEGGTSKKANANNKGAVAGDQSAEKAKISDPSDGGEMNPEVKKNVKVESEEAEEGEEIVEEEEVSEEVSEEKFDMAEAVDALFNGEEGLTEEFRTKAETIFEAAVTSRIKEELVKIEESYEQKLEEQYEEIAEGLVEHVDGYLNLMVEQWMEDNEVALETGLKSDIFEGFIGGLKSLFESHYINVPEDGYDIIGDLTEQVDGLNEKLAELQAQNVSLNNKINESAKEDLIEEACEGLSDIEKEKFENLAEELAFDDTESFTAKLGTIRENYFKKAPSKEGNQFLAEETVIEEEKQIPSDMRKYVDAINSLK